MKNVQVLMASTKDLHSIALLQRQQEEINQTNPTLAPFSTDIPTFLVLLRNNRAVACGGLRTFDVQGRPVAEIKRVYVVPEARGRMQGVSDFLMRQLEIIASEKSWKTIRLQTSKDMTAANKFYERHGYSLIPNYGDYIDCQYTISFEKTLS